MSWRKLIPVVAIAAGIVYLIVATPSGFSTDLSSIGGGRVAVVAVHDVNIVTSTEKMNVFGELHDRYGERAQFLVADYNTRPGRAFAQEHDALPASVLLFDAEGSASGKLPPGAGESEIAAAIDALLTTR